MCQLRRHYVDSIFTEPRTGKAWTQRAFRDDVRSLARSFGPLGNISPPCTIGVVQFFFLLPLSSEKGQFLIGRARSPPCFPGWPIASDSVSFRAMESLYRVLWAPSRYRRPSSIPTNQLFRHLRCPSPETSSSSRCHLRGWLPEGRGTADPSLCAA